MLSGQQTLKFFSQTEADDGRFTQGNVKEMTDKKEERIENLEDKGSFLGIGKSTFSDFKKKSRWRVY